MECSLVRATYSYACQWAWAYLLWLCFQMGDSFNDSISSSSCFSSPILIFCSPNHIASYCYYSHGKSLLWISFIAVFMVCIELELLEKKKNHLYSVPQFSSNQTDFLSKSLCKVSVHVSSYHNKIMSGIVKVCHLQSY